MTIVFLERKTVVDSPVHTYCIGVKAEISLTNISNPNETKTDVCAYVPRTSFFYYFLDRITIQFLTFPKKIIRETHDVTMPYSPTHCLLKTHLNLQTHF